MYREEMGIIYSSCIGMPSSERDEQPKLKPTRPENCWTIKTLIQVAKVLYTSPTSVLNLYLPPFCWFQCCIGMHRLYSL